MSGAGLFSLLRLRGRAGVGESQIAVRRALPHPNLPPQAGEGAEAMVLLA